MVYEVDFLKQISKKGLRDLGLVFDATRVSGAPFGDFTVITGEEDIRNGHAAKIVGFSILGKFKVIAV